MAWDGPGDDCEGQGTRPPTPPPTTRKPTREPTPRPTPRPTRRKEFNNNGSNTNDSEEEPDQSANLIKPLDPYDEKDATAKKVFDILDNVKSAIDNNLFLYQGSEPSSVYRYEGFIAGLRIMFEDGVAGKNFYLVSYPRYFHPYLTFFEPWFM